MDKHEEFIKKLKNVNPRFLTKYKILNRYTGNKNYLYIQTGYGIVKMAPSQILTGADATNRAAICYETFWINRAREKHGFQYEYSDIDPKKNTFKCWCRKCNDIYTQKMNSHISGAGCFKCSREKISKKLQLSRKEYIERCMSTFGNKYDYSSVVYSGATSKVEIRCSIHDYTFWQKPMDHLGGHEGCPKCANRLNTLELFIERANIVHKNFYKYPVIVEKYKNADKIEIICPIHGSFHQIADNHLNGSKCPTCAKTAYWSNRKSKDAELIPAIFYVLEFSNEKENFYKVGISTKFKNRLAVLKCAGYNVRVVDETERTLAEALTSEHEFLESFSAFKYTPKIKFDGHTECISVNPIDYLHYWYLEQQQYYEQIF